MLCWSVTTCTQWESGGIKPQVLCRFKISTSVNSEHFSPLAVVIKKIWIEKKIGRRCKKKPHLKGPPAFVLAACVLADNVIWRCHVICQTRFGVQLERQLASFCCFSLCLCIVPRSQGGNVNCTLNVLLVECIHFEWRQSSECQQSCKRPTLRWIMDALFAFCVSCPFLEIIISEKPLPTFGPSLGRLQWR